ncbi:MAG: CoA transferase [Betaproteobacteria bacterium]|nr:CoA transferase [Betaproteobacteria bacterium]
MTEQNGPLAGYRVLELSSTIAGPYCGRMFADFGAEVIKVEPAEGDLVRAVGKQFQGKSLYAASILRNKSLIALDLRRPEGQDVTRKLAAKCDFVVENFRAGALEKWGLGYEALSRGNPGLIMVRISGYGQSGPYSARPGYGIICEAVAGLRHLTGDPDRPPARVAVSLTDYITGLYGFSGAMMALVHKLTTGQGQVIDAALYESAFSFTEQHIAAYDKLGAVPNRLGSATGTAPNNLYRTRDGQYIHIAANGPAVFRRLAQLMQRPDFMEDARFKTALARARHHDEMDAQVAQWAAQHDLAALERMLNEAEVPATRIFTLADIYRDPHYKARGTLVEVPDDDLGSVTLAAPVPRLSRTPGRIRKSGGRIGQDTRRVLAELAGLSADEIAQLENAGVICCDKGKT